MNDYKPIKDTSEKGFPSINLPDWVKKAPKEVQPFIEQEYYVNPVQAELFMHCKNYDDIKKCRKELSHLYHTPQSMDIEDRYDIILLIRGQEHDIR
jgi:hypothetical protein